MFPQTIACVADKELKHAVIFVSFFVPAIFHLLTDLFFDGLGGLG